MNNNNNNQNNINQKPTKNLTNDEKIRLKEEERKRIIEAKRTKKLAMIIQKDTTKSEEKISAKGKYKERDYDITRYNPDINVGLSKEQVDERISQGYQNISHNGSTRSIPSIILKNIITFFNILTFAIGGMLLSVGAIKDVMFLVIVTANMVIGIVQEIKAKKTIDKLSLMSAPTAVLLRDSNIFELPVSSIVLDDILLLETGKQIASDSIVVEGSIEVNESLLTGESDAILKKPGDMLFSGSFVVSGKCKARVDKVGHDNYIERLSGQAKQYKKPKSDLLRSLNIIVKTMAVIIIPIGAFLFYTQFYKNGVDYVTSVRKTAGAMVGMIPSGLFLLSSVALAVGVMRLAQNNVMVQELYCIEMLARVNVLCLDKTGTITDGTMKVKNTVDFAKLGNYSSKEIISNMLGALNEQNMTSQALEEEFGKSSTLEAIATLPFSSQRKLNAVTFANIGTLVMGAPEFVLKDEYHKYQQEVEKHASKGYRVLLLAYIKGVIHQSELPQGERIVVSMVLIEDNIRPDAISTIDYFKRSGVEVKVISGDNPLTVSKISERAGIVNATEYISLDGLSDEEVIVSASKYTVFGRVSPAQKRLLVKTLKQLGKTVAMTGDGVNDILALKEADCSIAVASGSEAARNVSHLVLLDSNFSSMPKVVSEGRRVINNVASVACLFLTKTIFSFLLAMYALNSSAGEYPISTTQLIMIDALVIGFPSFFLVLEPNNKEVDGRFLYNILKGALPGAITILICSIVAFSLSNVLGLDSLTSSTIVAILATHTCLMVLIKVCRPFNLMRKVICTISYTLFILLIFFLPNFFEFRPLVSIAQYNSKKVITNQITNAPSISISASNKFILDNMYTQTGVPGDFDVNTSNPVFSVKSNKYLVINNTETQYVINTDLLLSSEDVANTLYLGGYKTSFFKGDTYQINVDENGNVSLTDTTTSQTSNLSYNILPNVYINPVGKVVINNMIYNSDTTYNNISSVTIKKSTTNQVYELYVNGSLFKYNDGTGSKTYEIAMPEITYTSTNSLVVNAIKTTYTDASLDLGAINITVQDGKTTYLANSKDTGVQIETPSVQVSSAGHYVLNNIYTNYISTQPGGESSLKLSYKEVSGKTYLVINGIETNYEVDVIQTVGGEVLKMSTPAMLLLVTLCALATPSMLVLTSIVPWVKSAYKSFSKLINKY